MGWRTGVNQGECDGCGYKEIVENRGKAPYWHDERRVSEGGAEDSFLLCDACHDKYLVEQRKADEAFEVFMRGLRK